MLISAARSPKSTSKAFTEGDFAAQNVSRRKVEMIESGIIIAGAGVLALVLVTYLFARRPVRVPVAVRIRIKKVSGRRS